MLLSASLLSLTGCADSHDKAAADFVAAVKEFNDALESVKDKVTAQGAKDKIVLLVEEMGAIKQRMAELGNPTKEQKKVLQEKYLKLFNAEGKRFRDNLLRVEFQPELVHVLKDAMKKLADIRGIMAR